MSEMRLTNTVIEWLEAMEWEERPEIDEAEQMSTTAFSYSLDNELKVMCYLDTYEKEGFVSLCIYFRDSKFPENKRGEVLKFINLVNLRNVIGCLHALEDDRNIRFSVSIDAEDAAFEHQHISNMLGAGVRLMELRLPQFMAICFGGKSAEEAVDMEQE